ncbi:50S ribosomal protein L3 [Planctomycetaceae bacterium]|nr:50S ribosomal protein L3 [Planctomycetaceae bacterium]
MPVTAMMAVKREMSQLFKDNGEVVPVTILSVDPATVIQVRTQEDDGYSAAQIGTGKIALKNVSKPLIGHFKKAQVEPKRLLHEVPLAKDSKAKAGDVIKVSDVFKTGDWVDVVGLSKGRGYQGGVKRHGFKGGPAAHGTKFMREPGSSGTNTSVAHVLPGKRMAGHMGVERKTVRNLLVAKVNEKDGLIYVRGAVPGFNGAWVEVRQARAKRAVKVDRTIRKQAAK